MGRSLIAIGILLTKTGRYDEALASYERARSVLGELAGPGPGATRSGATSPGAYYWTGGLLLSNRQDA